MSGRNTPTALAQLRRRHPRATTLLSAGMLLFLVANVVLAARWRQYRDETARLQGEEVAAWQARDGAAVATEAQRATALRERVRRQAAADRALHLSVSIDQGLMRLERDGALLREMAVHVGAEPRLAEVAEAARPATPRGVFAVERVLGPRDSWRPPDSPADSGGRLPTDGEANRALRGDAFVLTGGQLIYAMPDSVVPDDAPLPIPGAIRVSRRDLRAIAPIITPGVAVYVYE